MNTKRLFSSLFNRSISFAGTHTQVIIEEWNHSYRIQHADTALYRSLLPNDSIDELTELLSLAKEAMLDFESVWNRYPHPDGIGAIVFREMKR